MTYLSSSSISTEKTPTGRAQFSLKQLNVLSNLRKTISGDIFRILLSVSISRLKDQPRSSQPFVLCKFYQHFETFGCLLFRSIIQFPCANRAFPPKLLLSVHIEGNITRKPGLLVQQQDYYSITSKLFCSEIQ